MPGIIWSVFGLMGVMGGLVSLSSTRGFGILVISIVRAVGSWTGVLVRLGSELAPVPLLISF